VGGCEGEACKHPGTLEEGMVGGESAREEKDAIDGGGDTQAQACRHAYSHAHNYFAEM